MNLLSPTKRFTMLVIPVEPDKELEYPFEVQYDSTIAQLCSRAGLPDPPVFKATPVTKARGVKTRRLRLFGFDEYSHEHEAIQTMRAYKCEPADIWVLLTLARYMPDLQLTYPILGLGTRVVIKGGCEEVVVPCIRSSTFLKPKLALVSQAPAKEERVLDFVVPTGGFEPRYQYLGALIE